MEIVSVSFFGVCPMLISSSCRAVPTQICKCFLLDKKRKQLVSCLAAAMKFSKHSFSWRLMTEIRKQTWAEAENRDPPSAVAKQSNMGTLNMHGENLFCPVLLWISARTEKAKTLYIQDVRICVFDFDKPQEPSSCSLP
jgi:hypothetical protein